MSDRLKKIAMNLLSIGEQTPIDMRKIDPETFKFPSDQQHIFSEDGITYKLQFSVDIISDNKKLHHVSVSRTDAQEIDEEFIGMLEILFFDANYRALRFVSGPVLHLMDIKQQ